MESGGRDGTAVTVAQTKRITKMTYQGHAPMLSRNPRGGFEVSFLPDYRKLVLVDRSCDRLAEKLIRENREGEFVVVKMTRDTQPQDPRRGIAFVTISEKINLKPAEIERLLERIRKAVLTEGFSLDGIRLKACDFEHYTLDELQKGPSERLMDRLLSSKREERRLAKVRERIIAGLATANLTDPPEEPTYLPSVNPGSPPLPKSYRDEWVREDRVRVVVRATSEQQPILARLEWDEFREVSYGESNDGYLGAGSYREAGWVERYLLVSEQDPDTLSHLAKGYTWFNQEYVRYQEEMKDWSARCKEYSRICQLNEQTRQEYIQRHHEWQDSLSEAERALWVVKNNCCPVHGVDGQSCPDDKIWDDNSQRHVDLVAKVDDLDPSRRFE